MGIGGFVLRFTGSYSFIVLGFILLAAGLYRLNRAGLKDSDEEKTAYPEDRLLFRLKAELAPDQFIAVDYPLPSGEKIDLLVGTATGLFGIKKLNLAGTLNGRAEATQWDHIPRGEKTAGKIANPLVNNRQRLNELKQLLKSRDFAIEKIDVSNCLVLMKHNVQGTALELKNLFRLGEIAQDIRRLAAERDTADSWELLNSLEAALCCSMHRIY